MSVVLQIADAIVAELASAPDGTFNLAFTPERAVLPSYQLLQMSDLRVTVVPRSVELTNASRTLAQHEVEIDIGIQKRVGKDVDSDVEPLLDLVEKIGDYLRRRPLQQASFAAWVRATNEPVYASDHLSEQRLFTSVLTVVYRVLR